MEAGGYGYAHSAVVSENFPVPRTGGRRVRELVLLEFDRDMTAIDVMAEATRRRLTPPTYEDALYFGIEHADVQRERPVIFLHEPWLGHFGGRDVLCLWENAGRRELGLYGFDDVLRPGARFAFVLPASPPRPTA